ncbi:MAG: hypothetical protein IJQ29_00105 [Synergistaceae bacterium]|nr:hypothetical protein [Synergistaceae bacterium]
MKFSLQLSTKRGNAANKLYPQTATISSLDELKTAVQYDHVGGLFKDNTRSNDNFISCDVVIMDVDNDETENSDEWITPERIAAIFKDVEFCVIYSKSHNKIKTSGGKEFSARPRFHVYFTLSKTINNAEQVRALKEGLLNICSTFDANAKDAARFIFGVEEPDGLYFTGTRGVDEFMETARRDGELADANIFDNAQNSISHDVERVSDETIGEDGDDSSDGLSFKEIMKLEGRKFLNTIEKCSEIPAGYRDNTILKVANTALFAHEEGTAYSIFLDAVKKCEPQLGLDQVAKVWKQALKFTAKEKAKTEREAQKAEKAAEKAAAKAERDAQREEEKKKLLNNKIVEDFLIQNGISLRLNIISGYAEVSGLPDQTELLQDSFKKLSPEQKSAKSVANLSLYLNDALSKDNYYVNYKLLRERLSSIASSNEYNPVQEMLERVQWDGKDRIESLAEILNITLDRQSVTLLKKWLVQTVAMAFNEGRTALEFCLTLKGKQGSGKTSFFRIISMAKEREEFFKEGAILDVRDKDSIIKATSAWICELGEVDATLKKEQSNLKAFVTNTHDDYRRPYAENYEHAPRRTSFCATVNDDRFLRDLTGNRRWAVIEIDTIDKQALRGLSTEWLKQMWRQAYELYLSDNNYFRLTDEELNALEQENKKSIVLLPGETELYDLLNWDAPINEWAYTTTTEILRKLDIRNIDAQKLGYAIKKIARNDERIDKKRNKYGNTYLLPPLKSKSFN